MGGLGASEGFSSWRFPAPADAWFDLAFMHKDLELGLAEGRGHQIPLPRAERADEVVEPGRRSVR